MSDGPQRPIWKGIPLADTDSRLQAFLDEASIRNTIARFADAATRADYALFETVWAEDGEFVIGAEPHDHHATGRAQCIALVRKLRTERDFFVQFAIPGVIEIDRDTATTRTLVHEAARGPGDSFYRNHSIAFDRLQRSGDEWVFARRSFQYLWLDTSPFSGDAFPLFSTA